MEEEIIFNCMFTEGKVVKVLESDPQHVQILGPEAVPPLLVQSLSQLPPCQIPLALVPVSSREWRWVWWWKVP